MSCPAQLPAQAPASAPASHPDPCPHLVAGLLDTVLQASVLLVPVVELLRQFSAGDHVAGLCVHQPYCSVIGLAPHRLNDRLLGLVHDRPGARVEAVQVARPKPLQWFLWTMVFVGASTVVYWLLKGLPYVLR